MNRARINGFALTGALALTIASVGTVAADAVYHTERLALEPVGGAAGTGFVVNIHPNGPRIVAQERYALRGAEPNTTYTITLVVDGSDLACDFDSLPVLMAEALRTNGAGNGTATADFFFKPSDIPACLQGQSFPVHWEARLACGCTLTHRTEPTIVTLD